MISLSALHIRGSWSGSSSAPLEQSRYNLSCTVGHEDHSFTARRSFSTGGSSGPSPSGIQKRAVRKSYCGTLGTAGYKYDHKTPE